MNCAKLKTLVQLKAFMEGSAAIEFRSVGDDLARYEHVGVLQRRFGYGRLRRPDKRLVRRYLAHATGYSRACILGPPGQPEAAHPQGMIRGDKKQRAPQGAL